MVKSELIDTIAHKQKHIEENDIELSINCIIDMMAESLCYQDHRIEIRGFGSFSLHYRPPRNAHNPKTGEKVVTIAKYTPHFKPGKDLKDQVDESAQRGIDIKKYADELDLDQNSSDYDRYH